MQYTYARCCSILEKANASVNANNLDFSNLVNTQSYELIKILNKFPSTVLEAYEKQEPCLLVRLLMNIASEFNKFYTNNRIIDNGVVNNTNLAVVNMVKIVFENGFKIVNIPAISKM